MAAIAAAVTASTICCKEGAESASDACTVLGIGAREGRRCVIRGLSMRGGNDGVSTFSSAAWNITGGTCRRSRSVRWGCGPESLSEPEKVARFEFPRPLEGSSRRRWPVVVEESLARTPSGWRGPSRSYGGCREAIVHRRWYHKPLPRGHGGGGSRSRLVRLVG